MQEPFTIPIGEVPYALIGRSYVEDRDGVRRDALCRMGEQKIFYDTSRDVRRMLVSIFHEIVHAYHFHYWPASDIEGLCDQFGKIMLHVIEAFFGEDAGIYIRSVLERKQIASLPVERQLQQVVAAAFERAPEPELAGVAAGEPERRLAPLSTVEAIDCVAPPSYPDCAECGKKIAQGQIVNDMPEFGPVGWAVVRRAYCDHCNHVQTWTEVSTAKGTPTGDVFGKPEHDKNPRRVEQFLSSFPQARGVL